MPRYDKDSSRGPRVSFVEILNERPMFGDTNGLEGGMAFLLKTLCRCLEDNPFHCCPVRALPLICWTREMVGLEIVCSLLRAPISYKVGVTASTSQILGRTEWFLLSHTLQMD